FIESSNTYFHLTLIPKRWYKDKYINLNDTYSNETITSNGQNDQNDLLKRQLKGRPSTKQLKPSVEKSDSKGKGRGEQAISDRCHKCDLCEKYSHYHNTYSKG
ncbi:7799_t:CDS:2, partial [Funneliformis mosseae]